ncbi:hypothetical protein AK88_02986 [Plasmodium fragile]|uniref:Schizont-infected cell agglutination extracellular alpha domain-containing protein n=1 Tax=Plasmodium fragile TaxID=5857 RepID=A0A0D9QNM1_PLAFR|nr:uncharacterized protein AK88_02986 [Plasmodium fragile]KJP87306.1 hypothetical protein AK88_02986 [Plasmodium fragile]
METVLNDFVPYMEKIEEHIDSYATSCGDEGWERRGHPHKGHLYKDHSVGDVMKCRLMVGALYFVTGWKSTQQPDTATSANDTAMKATMRCIVANVFAYILAEIPCGLQWPAIDQAWKIMKQIAVGTADTSNPLFTGKCILDEYKDINIGTGKLQGAVKNWLKKSKKISASIKAIEKNSKCNIQWATYKKDMAARGEAADSFSMFKEEGMQGLVKKQMQDMFKTITKTVHKKVVTARKEAGDSMDSADSDVDSEDDEEDGDDEEQNNADKDMTETKGAAGAAATKPATTKPRPQQVQAEDPQDKDRVKDQDLDNNPHLHHRHHLRIQAGIRRCLMTRLQGEEHISNIELGEEKRYSNGAGVDTTDKGKETLGSPQPDPSEAQTPVVAGAATPRAPAGPASPANPTDPGKSSLAPVRATADDGSLGKHKDKADSMGADFTISDVGGLLDKGTSSSFNGTGGSSSGFNKDKHCTKDGAPHECDLQLDVPLNPGTINLGGSYGLRTPQDPHITTAENNNQDSGAVPQAVPDLTAHVLTATTPVLFFLSAVTVALLGYSLWKHPDKFDRHAEPLAKLRVHKRVARSLAKGRSAPSADELELDPMAFEHYDDDEETYEGAYDDVDEPYEEAYAFSPKRIYSDAQWEEEEDGTILKAWKMVEYEIPQQVHYERKWKIEHDAREEEVDSTDTLSADVAVTEAVATCSTSLSKVGSGSSLPPSLQNTAQHGTKNQEPKGSSGTGKADMPKQGDKIKSPGVCNEGSLKNALLGR